MAGEIFTEEQRFRSGLFWIPYLIVAALAVGFCVFRIAVTGAAAAHYWFLMFFGLWLFIAIGMFIWLCRLQTAVDGNGLHVRFYPLEKAIHNWDWDNIESWRVDTVRPLAEYRGWGVRKNPAGTAYIVSGGGCVRVRFKSGAEVCFGSAKPEEFAAALDRGMAEFAAVKKAVKKEV